MFKSLNMKLFRKIIGIVILLIMFSSISVFASNAKPMNVTIILTSGYEYNTLTTKQTVEDILKDRKIELKECEKTIPSLDSIIEQGQAIRIVPIDYNDVELSTTQLSKVTLEELLATYENIKEVIETVEVEIPFETITKVISEGDEQNTKVIQEGVNGLKEVKYKVTYQDDVEIERNVISETIIRDPVDKIIQISQKVRQTSSRGSVTRTGARSWSYSSSDFDLICAIVAQEGGGSYESALAVITTACNRTVSSAWAKNGSDPLSQFKAPGQFCYSIDSHWKKRLNGNYSGEVVRAVDDALNGKRNHSFLSFRAAYTGHAGTKIGGNVYFNSL